MRRGIAIAPAVVMTGGPFVGRVVSPAGAAETGDPARVGAFAAPIEEPTGHSCDKPQDPAPKCKPAAVALAVLPTGSAFYWDGLEGMNHVKYSTALEFGHTAQNDQSRVLDLSGTTPLWTVPNPEDSGVNPDGNPSPRYLPAVPPDLDRQRPVRRAVPAALPPDPPAARRERLLRRRRPGREPRRRGLRRGHVEPDQRLRPRVEHVEGPGRPHARANPGRLPGVVVLGHAAPRARHRRQVHQGPV